MSETSRPPIWLRGEVPEGPSFAAEKIPAPDVSAEELIRTLREVVNGCLTQLRQLDESQLDGPRTVGRAANASTMRGILHHAAEHAARHSGQVVTTTKMQLSQ